tara:strand:- start:38 stop:217 length:180 start_codon:yes stop_codon:yes gene_type:complete
MKYYDSYDDFSINNNKFSKNGGISSKNKDRKTKTTKEVYNSKHVRMQQIKTENSNAKKK